MPLPKTYYHDRFLTTVFVIPAVLFFLFGVVLLIRGEVRGLGAILGIWPFVYVIVRRLSPSKTFLKLDDEGFEASSVFGKAHATWADVSEIGVEGEGFSSRVGFNLRAGATDNTPRPDGAKFDKKLPEKFDVSPEELAQIMTELHRLYGRN